ncbi:hypothetical protein ACS212_14790, partial [Escherichia coli]
KRVFLVILFTSFSGSLVSRIPGAVQLIEQDPLVTIDITTHRYYGVGGQWVQDAGEYLHMMSDAGICIKGE